MKMMLQFEFIPTDLIKYIIGLVILFVNVESGFGGCSRGGRPLCCTSKDNTCFSYEFASGYHQKSFRKCYCDASCLLTRDCCKDYYKLCNVPRKNCKVSEWSRWSSCTTTCGVGKAVRWRKIVTLPENGGNHCPQLTEVKTCKARDCPPKNKETARLLPATEVIVSTVKKFDPKYDIRRNLYKRALIKRKNTTSNYSPYCVEYVVETVASRDCNSTDAPIRTNNNAFLQETWSNYLPTLTYGQKICVTCYPSYMTNKYGKKHCKGTGAFQNATPWTAVRLPNCRGTFRMIMRPRTCECPVRGQEAKQSFLFI